MTIPGGIGITITWYDYPSMMVCMPITGEVDKAMTIPGGKYDYSCCGRHDFPSFKYDYPWCGR